MRHYFALVAVAVALLLPGAGVAATPAAADALAGIWGTAEEVPGLAALDHGGSADLRGVSCGAAGNCAAGGSYTYGSGHQQAFVASQANGTWGSAQQVPGLAALDTGRFAGIYAVSCGAAGSCAAGGYFHQSSSTGPFQAFVVSEKKGTWGSAQQVPGLAALNTGGGAAVLSVSCASAGNCSAGGVYRDSVGREQAFVVSEKKGTWGTARQVPGSAALNQRGDAYVSSVSCAGGGNCAAGGKAGGHPYVVNQVTGTWGSAQVVPGIAALNHGGTAEVDAVSCAAAGNCLAGGTYGHNMGQLAAFVATETNGTWGTAQQIRGTAPLNTFNSELYSVSCGAAGNCAAAGSSADSSGHTQAFVANQANSRWHAAQEVPGIAALNQGGNAWTQSASCPAAGNCSAGGGYTDSSGHTQAFVVSETT